MGIERSVMWIVKLFKELFRFYVAWVVNSSWLKDQKHHVVIVSSHFCSSHWWCCMKTSSFMSQSSSDFNWIYVEMPGEWWCEPWCNMPCLKGENSCWYSPDDHCFGFQSDNCARLHVIYGKLLQLKRYARVIEMVNNKQSQNVHHVIALTINYLKLKRKGNEASLFMDYKDFREAYVWP